MYVGSNIVHVFVHVHVEGKKLPSVILHSNSVFYAGFLQIGVQTVWMFNTLSLQILYMYVYVPTSLRICASSCLMFKKQALGTKVKVQSPSHSTCVRSWRPLHRYIPYMYTVAEGKE